MSQMFVKQNQEGINLKLNLSPIPTGVEPQTSRRHLRPNEPINLGQGEQLFVTGHTTGPNLKQEYTLAVGRIGPNGEFEPTQDTYPREIVLKNGTVYITTKTTGPEQAIYSEPYKPLSAILGKFTSAREYYLNLASSREIVEIYNRSLNQR